MGEEAIRELEKDLDNKPTMNIHERCADGYTELLRDGMTRIVRKQVDEIMRGTRRR